MSGSLHADAIVFDGLEVMPWGHDTFEAMHAGGVTAANCTVSVWEGFAETMRAIARFKSWFAEHDDLIRPVRTVADVRAAKREGRVGIALGFQNLAAIEDDLAYLALFKELGVGFVQLAYNTQNLAGAGCYEAVDPGLSGFGREVLAELNRLRIVVDLSHVGPRTSRDALEHSTQPVVYSHVCPAALNPHPRNKTDEEMRAVAERGGIVGANLLPWFLPAGAASTVEDYLDAIAHMVDAAGEDHVGIGTDFMQGHGVEYFRWLRRDKGRGRFVTPPPASAAELALPAGLARVEELPNLTAGMERRGWSETRIRKLLGENWLRLLEEVWGA